MNHSPEHHRTPRSPEHPVNNHELKNHHEKLERSRHERAEKASRHEKDVTEVRHAAKKEALSSTEYHQPKSEKTPAAQTHTKADKLHSFNTTMSHVRRNLSAPERTLSKLVHQPLVEKTSEVLGKTVARPSGVVGAGVAAFIGLFSVYSVARFAGFALSGSEMPILLAVGFLAGLFLEWAFKALRSIFASRFA